MRCVAFVTGLLACLLLSPIERAAAQSSDYSTLTSPQSAQNWNLKLGAGLRYQPDYAGSDDYIFRPRPIISLGRGIKSTWWSSEDDGLSIGFFSGQGWRVGFSGNLLWERQASTNPALMLVRQYQVRLRSRWFRRVLPDLLAARPRRSAPRLHRP